MDLQWTLLCVAIIVIRSQPEETDSKFTCPELKDPENGSVNFTNTNIGSIATFSCMHGFTINGDTALICETVSTCNNYILNGDSTSDCNTSNSWNSTFPVCEDSQRLCPELSTPKNGRVRVRKRKVGSKAKYECYRGFKLNGDDTIVCGSDMTWKGIIPTCDERFCKDIPAPVNGVVEFTNQKRVYSEAIYSCLPTHILIGSKTISCEATSRCVITATVTGEVSSMCIHGGEWVGTPPTCEEILCTQLSSPVNGSVNFSRTDHGYTALYECDSGFILSGNSTLECDSDGNWNSEIPTCDACQPPGWPVKYPDDYSRKLTQPNSLTPGVRGKEALNGRTIEVRHQGTYKLYIKKWHYILFRGVKVVTTGGTLVEVRLSRGKVYHAATEVTPGVFEWQAFNNRTKSIEIRIQGLEILLIHKVELFGCIHKIDIAQPVCTPPLQPIPNTPHGYKLLVIPNSLNENRGFLALQGKPIVVNKQGTFIFEMKSLEYLVLTGINVNATGVNLVQVKMFPMKPYRRAFLLSPGNFTFNGHKKKTSTLEIRLEGEGEFTVHDLQLVGCLKSDRILVSGVCPLLKNPIGGEVRITSLNPGGKALFECKSGYALIGQGFGKRVCQKDGTWSGGPVTCVAPGGSKS